MRIVWFMGLALSVGCEAAIGGSDAERGGADPDATGPHTAGPPAEEVEDAPRDVADSYDAGLEAHDVVSGGDTEPTLDAEPAEDTKAAVDAEPADDTGPAADVPAEPDVMPEPDVPTTQAPDAGPGEVSPACPPTGPFGVTVGDVVADLALLDCDKNPVTLHSLCGNAVTWVYSYAEWCPNCKSNVKNVVGPRDVALGPLGLKTVLIAEQGNTGPATATLCKALQTQVPASVLVLYDPTESFKTLLQQAGPNEISLVLSQGGRIEYLQRYASQSEVGAKLEALLND